MEMRRRNLTALPGRSDSYRSALAALPGHVWIPRNIKKSVCRKYAATSMDDGDCQCGYPQGDHEAEALQHPESSDVTCSWTVEKDTRMEPTDAYGQVEFSGSLGHPTAKYYRVSHQTDMAVMQKLLKDYVHLDPPNLLISVIGGGKKFQMKPQLIEKFRQGLVKVAKKTGAWIITGGMHAGVTKEIGNAIHHHTVAHGRKAGLVCLGIAAWGCVEGKESLVKKGGSWPAEYRIHRGDVDEVEATCQSFLDPNHTHFVLVDNGTQHKYGVEIDFRARLEAYISKNYCTDKIATVSVVIEGGPGTIRTVHRTIMEGTPVVIVAGSGRAADILAWTYAESEDRSKYECVKESVKKMIQENFPAEKPEDQERLLSNVIECCQRKRDYMTVVRLDTSNPSTEIDIQILQALLKVGKEFKNQLELALTLDCVDIAKDMMLKDDAKWQMKTVQKLLKNAILNNRVDFVKLFIEYIDFHEFLKTEKWNKGVQQGLKELLGQDSSKAIANIKDSDSNGQIFLLFLRAILQRHFDLAEVFWKQGKDRIATALLARKLLKAMAGRERDLTQHTELLKYMDYCESLAVGALTECYNEDERKAQLLLTRTMPNFVNKTPLKLAMEADSKVFIAHVACQSVFDRIWMGKMAAGHHPVLLGVCLLLSALIVPKLITFREDAWEQTDGSSDVPTTNTTANSVVNGRQIGTAYCNTEEDTEHYKFREGTYCEKLVAFFHAPVIVFSCNTVSFLGFIGLFSFILLTSFHPVVSIEEYVLVFWVGTLILEEIRQAYSMGLCQYCKDNGSRHDMVTMAAFVVGYVFRFLPTTRCHWCLEVARIILALDLMLFYLRMLHIFSIHRKLGPILVMIRHMMVDMAYFIIILMVFVTAYGVTLQVILYPNSPLQFSLIDDIFKKAYFQIYGELFLDELEGTLTCEATPTANSTLPRCPENTLFVPKTLLAFYILFTNVLMLNLLIAMFSYTFNKIETNTDEHWSFEQYFLIKEYHDRPPMPPPFIILNQIYRLFRCLCNKCDPKKVENNFAMTYPEPLDRELTMWENINVGEYVRQTQIKRQQSLDSRVKETQDRVETIAHKLEDSNLSPRRPISASHVSQTGTLPVTLDERLSNIESQIERVTTLLEGMKLLMKKGYINDPTDAHISYIETSGTSVSMSDVEITSL